MLRLLQFPPSTKPPTAVAHNALGTIVLGIQRSRSTFFPPTKLVYIIGFADSASSIRSVNALLFWISFPAVFCFCFCLSCLFFTIVSFLLLLRALTRRGHARLLLVAFWWLRLLVILVGTAFFPFS